MTLIDRTDAEIVFQTKALKGLETENRVEGFAVTDTGTAVIDIGILGLDTSHAEKFTEIVTRRSDATISAVWDGGEVRDETYVTAFCNEYDTITHDRPEALIERVDAAMVLTVDWDRHAPLAERCFDAGVPMLIDKPIAGSIEDIETIRRRAGDSTPVFGGSAVPYHPSLSEMRRSDGRHDLFVAGYNSPFYYGVHLTDTVRTICGADWRRIEPAVHNAAVTVAFADGSNATLRFDGPTEDAAFGLLDVSTTVRTASIEGNETAFQRMYEPYIDAFLETVRGERGRPDWLFDAATLHLGIQAALEGNETIYPDSSELFAVSKDGTAFTQAYKPLY